MLQGHSISYPEAVGYQADSWVTMVADSTSWHSTIRKRMVYTFPETNELKILICRMKERHRQGLVSNGASVRKVSTHKTQGKIKNCIASVLAF